ncbi:MAG: hypothetical protein VW338_03545 [Rhodospirillaceae bacterium]
MTEMVGGLIETGALAGVVFLLIQRIERQMRNQNLILVEFMKAFVAHDAQVRGVNPSVGDDNERCQEAAKNYEQLQRAIDQLREAIRQ